MNEVFLDTEYVMASVSQGQVCVCVLSYVNVMEVCCSSFMSHVCSVWSFSHCLYRLTKVAQLCLSSRHNFILAQAKLLYLVHA